MAQDDDDGYG
jgi:hypothetical protein